MGRWGREVSKPVSSEAVSAVNHLTITPTPSIVFLIISHSHSYKMKSQSCLLFFIVIYLVVENVKQFYRQKFLCPAWGFQISSRDLILIVTAQPKA